MTPQATRYALKANLDLPFEEALEKVAAALRAEGFGVLTTIDVKETLGQKLGVEFRKYIILGACNPSLAHRALEARLDAGLLLPCNVVVYEEDGGAVAVITDPVAMLGLVDHPALEDMAREARARLERVVAALGN